MPEMKQIPIAEIDIDPLAEQRLNADDAADDALTQSMASVGQLVPILAQIQNGQIKLLAGTRRFKAAKKLGWDTITAAIYSPEEPLSPAASLIENACRSNLTPIEESAAVAELIENHNLSPEAVAALFGHTPQWVQDRLTVLGWPNELQEALHHRLISSGVANQLSQINDEEHRRFLLAAATEHGCTIRQAMAWRIAWQQDAALASPPERVDAHEPSGQAPPTLVQPCFLCQEQVAMEKISRIPVCPGCCGHLRDAARPPSQPSPHP